MRAAALRADPRSIKCQRLVFGASSGQPGTEATHLSNVGLGHSYIAQGACTSTLASWQLRRHCGLFCGVRSHICRRLAQGFCQRSDWETHGRAYLQYEALEI